MFGTLVRKELKNIIAGPKFAATFLACSVLILLGVYVGIVDFKADMKQYETAVQLEQEQLQEQHSWSNLATRVFRKPDPMQIFVGGVSRDIGRFSVLEESEAIRLTGSAYSNDTVFAVFRFIDLHFIFMVVMSLFAILFTYDSINGERESGTLKLVFTNPVKRSTYIFAKFTGSWLGLAIPLVIPVLTGLLLVLVFRVPMTAGHWGRLLLFLAVSGLYCTFFLALGLMVSAMTRRSSVSFLVLLVSWVAMTLIVPKAAVMAAGKLAPVLSVAQIESRIDRFSSSEWERHIKWMEETSIRREREMSGMTEDERKAHRENNEWNWLEEGEKVRKTVQAEIWNNSKRMYEELGNLREKQERLAFVLSRVSPASAYRLASMNLAGTDTGLKGRCEGGMERYHDSLYEFATKREKESPGGSPGIMVTIDSENGLTTSAPRDTKTIDTSGMPRFAEGYPSMSQVVGTALTDTVLIFIYLALALLGAVSAFSACDLR
jgi:ABC-type transport system involved in multi-copper enzyme maturation permease subunit